MKAEIISVGTELLLGDTINTNAPYIAKELANMGINVYYQSVVGDNGRRLADMLSLAFSRATIVVLTGGLGPTYDDLTKETVAKYFDVPLILDEKSLNDISEYFETIDRPMTENNRKQAWMPEGATVFANKWGTAPGLAISDGERTAVLLPGPPSEMRPMFHASVVPYLLKLTDHTILLSKNVRLFGIGESQLEEILSDRMKKASNPTIAPYAKTGEVSLRVTASASSKKDASIMIDKEIEYIEAILGKYIYGIDVENLQHALVECLKEKKLKIAFAESCTGGLLSQQITQIPGSSDVFDCGICSYANSIKNKLLDVKIETLEKYGAVSEETAIEMARGVRKIADADIGVSTTGIAGPEGGTEEKPVGTVFVGIDSKNHTEVLKLNLGNRRTEDVRKHIRYRTAQYAFGTVLKIVKNWS